MPKPLKILSIVPFPLFPLQSGGQNKAFGLLQTLAKYHQVTLISPVERKNIPPLSFKVKPSTLSPKFYRYFNFFALPSLLKESKKADIIMIEQPFFGVLALIIRFVSRKKLIINTHNVEYQRFKTLQVWWWKLLKSYEGYVLNRADLVFFISEEDRIEALKVFNLSAKKCFVSPYGIELQKEKKQNRDDLHKTYPIPDRNNIFLFFGKMDYAPNLAAFKLIKSKVVPALKKNGYSDFTILICGRGLPNNTFSEKDKEHIYYAGFVEDLHAIIRNSDLILNPVTSGGGVKTKVLEAIAHHKTVISTKTGALGIDQSVCGKKLQIAKDDDWDNFAKLCIASIEDNSPTPPSFFEKYSWEGIGRQYEEKLKKSICL